MAKIFVGRQSSLIQLHSLENKQTASFAVITGRRRIGKSRLIKEFAKGKTLLSFVGLAPELAVTAQDQRDEFSRLLATQTSLPQIKSDDWGTLFSLLASQTKTGRKIILLDEISWMGQDDPLFLPKLKTAWDEEFSLNPELILIACGSVSTWIEKNILSSSGFLGRIALKINLDELSLSESVSLLHAMGFHYSTLEKLIFLAIVGGIPWYLELLDPKINAVQNIKRMCFSKDGILVQEFDKIFMDLFKKENTIYTKIVATLANGAKSFETIAKTIEYANSGSLTEYLNNLEITGFIQRHYRWDINVGSFAKLSHYYLTDNYIRFYLKYIKPRLNTIKKTAVGDIDFMSLSGLTTFLGLQFENMLLHNRTFLLAKLGISASDIICDGPYFQRKTTKQEGCQIDYLIQTRFKTLYVIEAKFSINTIHKTVITEVQEKIKKLKLPKGFSVLPVLVYVGNLAEAVLDTDYFTFLINVLEEV